MSKSPTQFVVLIIITLPLLFCFNKESLAIDKTVPSEQGNIDLSSESSSSTLTLNIGGALSGNVTMDNSSQITTFNGGVLNGKIDGAGKVVINYNAILNGNIGDAAAITSLTINDGKTLDLTINNNSIRSSGAVSVGNGLRGGTLLVGTGTISASIQGSEDGVGIVRFNANNNLSGNVGTTTTSLALVSIASNTTLTTNSRNIDASTIAIGSNGILNYGKGSIIGSVEGESDGVGSFIFNNTKTTAFSIGQNGNSLANINLLDDITATMGGNISATTINVGSGTSGTLKSNGKNITATNINLAKGATLNISTNSMISGAINGVNHGDGIVQFSGGVVNQTNSLGTTRKLAQILVSNEATLNINSNINLNTDDITIGEGSSGRAGTPILNQNNGTIGVDANSQIRLNSGAILNYNGGIINGTVRGTSPNKGTFNINNDYTNNSEIGKSYDLANLNIASNKTLTANANISVNNISVAGTLNLGNSPKIITGNITTSDGGIIDLGSANHTITGNLSIHNSDFLKINTLNNSNISSLSASGIVVIENNANLKLTFDPNNGYLSNGLQVAVISGGAGSNINAITDNNIDVNGSGSNQSGLITFKTKSSGNNLLLIIDKKGAETFSKNQYVTGVYYTIDQVGSKAKAELLGLQNIINNAAISNNQREVLLKSTLPQNSQDLNNSALSSTSASVDVANSRLQNILFQPNQRIGNFSSNKLAKTFTNLINRDNPANITFANLNNQIFDNQAIWVQGFNGNASQDNVGYVSGYKYTNYGLAIGADQEIAQDLRLGISSSLSIADVTSNSTNQKTTNIKSHQFNLYGGYNFAPYFVSGILGVALNQYSSTRAMSEMNLNAKANYNGQTYIAKFEGGMIKKLGLELIATPKISLTLAKNQIATYNETGAGTLNLQVSNASNNFLEARLGGDLGYDDLKIFSTKLQPKIKLSYGYNFLAGDQSSKNSFVGQGNSFAITNSNVDKASIKYGFGLDIYQEGGILFVIDYDVEQKSSYKSSSGSLYLRYDF